MRHRRRRIFVILAAASALVGVAVDAREPARRDADGTAATPSSVGRLEVPPARVPEASSVW